MWLNELPLRSLCIRCVHHYFDGSREEDQTGVKGAFGDPVGDPAAVRRRCPVHFLEVLRPSS